MPDGPGFWWFAPRVSLAAGLTLRIPAALTVTLRAVLRVIAFGFLGFPGIPGLPGMFTTDARPHVPGFFDQQPDFTFEIAGIGEVLVHRGKSQVSDFVQFP